MAKKKFLMYKGRPLVRNGKTVYYGYMSDPYVLIMQITSTREVNGVEVAVSVNEFGVAEISCEENDVVEVDFTTATGISSVAGNGTTDGATEIYDITGRRLSEVPAGQVYIQNGQKKVSK